MLQELDLVGPVVTIGRSSECQISLDDPLVSRVHAQLTIGDDGALVRDLGSRNGVRVNGHLIPSETPLQHKDRLRLGTQDLVFLVIREGAESTRVPRSTGSMAHCKQCERPFPGEASSCPHCGARAPGASGGEGRETITSVEAEGSSWTFRLLAEVIERAIRAGRGPEAERMLARAARQLDERLGSGERLGHEQVAGAARLALQLAVLKLSPGWAEWALRLYRSEPLLPAGEALDVLEAMDAELLRAVRPELEALLIDFVIDRGADASSSDQQAEEMRLAALVRQVAG